MFIEIYDEALDEHEDEQQQQTSSEDHAIVDSVVRECRNEMERRKWTNETRGIPRSSSSIFSEMARSQLDISSKWKVPIRMLLKRR